MFFDVPFFGHFARPSLFTCALFEIRTVDRSGLGLIGCSLFGSQRGTQHEQNMLRDGPGRPGEPATTSAPRPEDLFDDKVVVDALQGKSEQNRKERQQSAELSET